MSCLKAGGKQGLLGILKLHAIFHIANSAGSLITVTETKTSHSCFLLLSLLHVHKSYINWCSISLEGVLSYCYLKLFSIINGVNTTRYTPFFRYV
jgi:hypothetical protein